MSTCERCGAVVGDPDSFELIDYCAVCSTNLCDTCMKEGCCGYKPALSGTEADDDDDDD